MNFVTIPQRGSSSYLSYHFKGFDIARVAGVRVRRHASSDRITRDRSIRELHVRGLSYPEVAIWMKVSVGLIWSVVNRPKKL